MGIVFVSREVIRMDCPGGYIAFVTVGMVFVSCEVMHMAGSLRFTCNVLVGIVFFSYGLSWWV